MALALTTLIAEEDLIAGLNGYEPAFAEHYNALMRAKLGLASAAPQDGALIRDLLGVMARTRCDYTPTFRRLSCIDANEPA